MSTWVPKSSKIHFQPSGIIQNHVNIRETVEEKLIIMHWGCNCLICKLFIVEARQRCTQRTTAETLSVEVTTVHLLLSPIFYLSSLFSYIFIHCSSILTTIFLCNLIRERRKKVRKRNVTAILPATALSVNCGFSCGVGPFVWLHWRSKAANLWDTTLLPSLILFKEYFNYRNS
jgi:hypothetical protein